MLALHVSKKTNQAVFFRFSDLESTSANKSRMGAKRGVELTTVLASAHSVVQGRDSEFDTSCGSSLALDVSADNVEGCSTARRSKVRGRP